MVDCMKKTNGIISPRISHLQRLDGCMCKRTTPFPSHEQLSSPAFHRRPTNTTILSFLSFRHYRILILWAFPQIIQDEVKRILITSTRKQFYGLIRAHIRQMYFAQMKAKGISLVQMCIEEMPSIEATTQFFIRWREGGYGTGNKYQTGT